MTAKQIFIPLLFILTGFILSAQENPAVQQPVGSIIIDGLPNDWQQEFGIMKKDNKLSYAINNDDEYIYFCFQTADKLLQQKMLRAGMNLNLSAKGEKKFKTNISYPVKSNVQPQARSQRQPGQMGQATVPDRSQMRQRQLERLTEMRCRGFISLNGRFNNSNQDIQLALNWASEYLLCYEIKIPFRELFGDDYSTEDILTPMQLKLTINSISSPSGNRGGNMSGRGGGSRGGSGSRAGGGRPQGGMRPGGGQTSAAMNAMSTVSVYKQQFQLQNTK